MLQVRGRCVHVWALVPAAARLPLPLATVFISLLLLMLLLDEHVAARQRPALWRWLQP